ncbi:MAG: STAS domain-containing protein [Rhizomicrobium sp.]
MESVMAELAPPGEGTPQLALPAVLDLTTGSELKRQLESALVKGCGLDIDAGQVQRVASPCLQILAAAAKSFVEAGGPALRFGAVSPEFRETVSTLGLDEIFAIKGLQS